MSTEYFAVDLISQFTCDGASCPKHCCSGWGILLDDECIAAYNSVPGLRGKYYRAQISYKNPASIKKIFTKCPFLSPDKKCVHQQSGNEKLMPLVCRNYPRRVIQFDQRTEIMLELSCPRCADLFLATPGRRKLLPYGKHLKPYWEINNYDEDFLAFLLGEREKILDYIWEEKPLYIQFETLFAYVYNQNDLIARDKIAEAKKVELTEDKTLQGSHAVYGDRGYSFYPIKAIDRMLLQAAEDNVLRYKEPWVYRFIKRYLKMFSKLTLDKANKTFHEEMEKMIAKQGELELKYRSYFSYLIQQEYLISFETYSIIRELMLAFLFTQILMLFDLMEYKKTGPIDVATQSRILYEMEHNIRHSPSLTNNLYSIIREEFL